MDEKWMVGGHENYHGFKHSRVLGGDENPP